MDIAAIEQFLNFYQTTISNGKFEDALKHLEASNLGNIWNLWFKGKIHLMEVKRMEESFTFKFYPSELIKSKHLDLMKAAHGYFFQVSQILPDENQEIQSYFNGHIWREMLLVEHEIARFTPDLEINEDDVSDHPLYKEHQAMMIDFLTEDIGCWNLSAD